MESFGEEHPNQLLIQKALDTQSTIKEHTEEQLIIATPILESDIMPGVLYMEFSTTNFIDAITQSDANLEALGKENKRNMFRWQIVFTCLSLMIGVVMAYRIGSSFSSPINNIIKQLRHYKSNRFSLITSRGEYNELNHLVDAFIPCRI